MIAYLRGTLLKKLDQQVILDVQGVGYLVAVPQKLFDQLNVDEPAAFFIHTRVKEDDLSLFGFQQEAELTFFQQLMSVSGIGAKTAMAILNMPLDATQSAINQENIAYLSQVPGLGKKTAARLALELKGKVEISITLEEPSASVPHSLQEEALEALLSLGYDKPTVIRFLNETSAEYDTAEELVRDFLQSA